MPAEDCKTVGTRHEREAQGRWRLELKARACLNFASAAHRRPLETAVRLPSLTRTSTSSLLLECSTEPLAQRRIHAYGRDIHVQGEYGQLSATLTRSSHSKIASKK